MPTLIFMIVPPSFATPASPVSPTSPYIAIAGIE
jgi:hypothetical protein